VPGAAGAGFADALRPNTKLVWVETPANPLLQLVDIADVARVSQAAKVPLVVDNTFSSPFFQRPLTLGADVVVHSTTKYINGHSDVIGGAVVTTRADLHEKFYFHQNSVGAVPGPLDCWLTLRGLKTLAVRMRQHAANAQRIAEWLTTQSKARDVVYPGLPSHPQHALAKRQMSGFGAMVSFRVAGGLDEASRFVRSLHQFIFAESLGGVESLVCHPATMSHAVLSPEERAKMGVSDNLIRLSIGIEDVDDLLEDLEQALAAV
jgi:cystathionine beta-lyase/cystathionine gamma-synthase